MPALRYSCDVRIVWLMDMVYERLRRPVVLRPLQREDRLLKHAILDAQSVNLKNVAGRTRHSAASIWSAARVHPGPYVQNRIGAPLPSGIIVQQYHRYSKSNADEHDEDELRVHLCASLASVLKTDLLAAKQCQRH